VSELRSALDELAGLDLAELPDARLEEEFAEIQHARRVLEAQHLRCLAEIDWRASFQASGHLSTASWLQDRYREGPGLLANRCGRRGHSRTCLAPKKHSPRETCPATP
jgi:hypothetical protein